MFPDKLMLDTEKNIYDRTFVVLGEYFEKKTGCNRYNRKISKSRRSPSLERNQSYLHFLIKQMETVPRSYQ